LVVHVDDTKNNDIIRDIFLETVQESVPPSPLDGPLQGRLEGSNISSSEYPCIRGSIDVVLVVISLFREILVTYVTNSRLYVDDIKKYFGT
jgi:hypothetical protein